VVALVGKLGAARAASRAAATQSCSGSIAIPEVGRSR
jgi:hypothetical protein